MLNRTLARESVQEYVKEKNEDEKKHSSKTVVMEKKDVGREADVSPEEAVKTKAYLLSRHKLLTPRGE